MGEQEVGEALDEGRGGGVEAGVDASGEKGVGLDQALEVGVVAGLAELAGDAGVTFGELASGAAKVLELAFVEIEVVHELEFSAEVDAAARGQGGAQAQRGAM